MTPAELIDECAFQAAAVVVATAIGIRVACVRVVTDAAKAAGGSIDFIEDEPSDVRVSFASKVIADFARLNSINPKRKNEIVSAAWADCVRREDSANRAAVQRFVQLSADVKATLDELHAPWAEVSRQLAIHGYVTGGDVRRAIEKLKGEQPASAAAG